ncbi:MarR family transcriptional regulator [Saccharopolyspora hirsuta]|uniref:MarR family winged helix-turn-helix transcriptional regulator n=1 Tax=Saccharopolyspora hirsuta TaxID=1837 RepID=UPI00331B7EEE
MADSEARLTLDRQLCFALYSASRAFTNLYRPFLGELGLTYPQYLVMLVLWERESLAVKELGAALRLDSGTLSPLLKRLEARGLVVRERSSDDERSVFVALTGEGRDLKERAREIPGRMLAATGLELDGVVELRSTLEQLTAALDTAAEAHAESKQESQR